MFFISSSLILIPSIGFFIPGRQKVSEFSPHYGYEVIWGALSSEHVCKSRVWLEVVGMVKVFSYK